MQTVKIVMTIASCLVLISCFTIKRSAESGYGENLSPHVVNSKASYNANPTERQHEAVEMGFDPHNLSSDQIKTLDNKRVVKNLEAKLESKRDKENYSKILPWFKDDNEKIEFLSLQSREAKSNWVAKKKILMRSQSPSTEFKDLIDSQDIAIGMPMDYVKKSWGEPISVEVSGNPAFKNARWKYLKSISTPEGFKQEKRFVYFESGRVVGWDSE
jgi:hypothetical protein